jgi:hypothetical protein
MSAKGRARIVAAQRARWAKVHRQAARTRPQTNVSIGSSQDCSSTTGEMGKGEDEESDVNKIDEGFHF